MLYILKNTIKAIITAGIITSIASADFPAKVVHVSDGDTIKVINMRGQETTIRILYIDTPEKFESSKLQKNAKRLGYDPKAEQELGKLASEYAHKKLDNQMVIIKDEKGLDRYQRMLASVKINDYSYAAKIISDGYSCIYKKEKYPEELDRLLASAKYQKKGLWAVDYKTMDKLCK